MMAKQDFWKRLSESVQRLGWEERLIIGVVVLASLIAIAIYAVRLVRRGLAQSTATISDHLTDFRRMRDSGEIDDQEFSRVVNTVSKHELDEPLIPTKDRSIQPSQSQTPPQGT